MKKIILLVLVFVFAFNTNVFASYTETREYSIMGGAYYEIDTALENYTYDTVKVTLYSKGPIGQLDSVFSTTVNVGPGLGPFNFYVGYLTHTKYVLKFEFQGNSGAIGPTQLQQVY
ncbi:hypothetical protein I6N90_14980 [Paenibacillus sp. GSMTC-2017]|uniref:hypothetical protein n=1 Tax=Paenibacillus sp. GSMTC-2017 TaxID=2794350 RepID=UPI0018D68B97|nr:hypothetical protein [Paenibacillus sp. GSMTC-2017]MBH5319109.1 hypothetical protein [Paenibacillus sp. GSMTC-2017]